MTGEGFVVVIVAPLMSQKPLYISKGKGSDMTHIFLASRTEKARDDLEKRWTSNTITVQVTPPPRPPTSSGRQQSGAWTEYR